MFHETNNKLITILHANHFVVHVYMAISIIILLTLSDLKPQAYTETLKGSVGSKKSCNLAVFS